MKKKQLNDKGITVFTWTTFKEDMSLVEVRHRLNYGDQALTFDQLKETCFSRAAAQQTEKDKSTFQQMTYLSKKDDVQKRFVIFNVNLDPGIFKEMLMDYDKLFREVFVEISHLLKDDKDSEPYHTFAERTYLLNSYFQLNF